MNVYIKIFGDYGVTKETKLKTELTDQKKSKTHDVKFQKNNVKEFLSIIFYKR